MLLANDNLIRELKDRRDFAEKMAGDPNTGREWSRVYHELCDVLAKIKHYPG